MGHLELRNVTKRFKSPTGDDIIAVDDATLSIEKSEFLVLVGPSGSGKSTLLRMIAGLEEVSEGETHLAGQRIDGKSPTERNISMVFQNYALYPHLTAKENIGFGLRMSGKLSNDEIEEKVHDVASLLEIEDLLPKMPGDLSGGQQQRVALGRAIIREPEAFLMDEPLSNLDAKLRDTMRTEILELQQNLGVTTVYVTHDQTEAMTMGDRIAVLNRGKIQQVATPMKLYYNPANEFVAEFIGNPSMNFFDGEARDKNVIEVSTANDSALIDVSEHDLGGFEGDVRIGIRPEDLEVISTSAERTLEVTIDVIEPLGREKLIYFDIQGTRMQAIVPSDLDVSQNQTAYISINGRKAHIFNAATGETISNRSTPKDKELPRTAPA